MVNLLSTRNCNCSCKSPSVTESLQRYTEMGKANCTN